MKKRKQKKKGRRSDKEIGRTIRTKVNCKNEATVIGPDGVGVRPRKGLWLVHHGRRRVYGQILMVRSNGDIIWRPVNGHEKTRVGTRPQTIHDSGVSYTKERPGDYI